MEACTVHSAQCTESANGIARGLNTSDDSGASYWLCKCVCVSVCVCVCVCVCVSHVHFCLKRAISGTQSCFSLETLLSVLSICVYVTPYIDTHIFDRTHTHTTYMQKHTHTHTNKEAYKHTQQQHIQEDWHVFPLNTCVCMYTVPKCTNCIWLA